ncbi:MAG: hypothetical protein QXI33_00375 [Candidatus Pacearchaeota archaeon]
MRIEDGVITSSDIPRPRSLLDIAIELHGLEDIGSELWMRYDYEKANLNSETKTSVDTLAYYLINGLYESARQLVDINKYPYNLKRRIYALKPLK